MERLIYSNNPKLHNPFLPQFHASTSRNLRSLILPSSPTNLIRLSCNLQYPSSNFRTPVFKDSDKKLSGFPEHGSGRILYQIVDTVSLKEKVVASGTAILISAILVLLIRLLFLLSGVATFQTAGPVAATAGSRLFCTEVLTSALAGFFSGCLHTLSGHDHRAVLAPLSIGHALTESAVAGALWGCGHDAEQAIFGLLFLLVKNRLRIEVVPTWGTRVVAFTLLVIGAMGILEATEVPTPCDVSVNEGLENLTAGKEKIGSIAFVIGIAHGLQLDALLMVLPALGLPSFLAGAAFLGMFLVGTIIAMGSCTVFIGMCSQARKHRIPRITKKLAWGSSLIAITLGFGIIISQLFGFSLY